VKFDRRDAAVLGVGIGLAIIALAGLWMLFD
jgi:hypothetical protein